MPITYARRKFEQALYTSPEKAQYVLKEYRKLYQVEKHCKDQELNFDLRLEIRKEKAVPELNLMILQPGVKNS